MIIKPCIKKSVKTSGGKFNIKISVAHNGLTRYIGTEYYIESKYFKKDGTISDKYENAAFLNTELKSKILEYEKKLLAINKRNLHVNRIIELLKEDTKPNDFSAYFEKFIREKEKLNKRTSEIYQATLNKIRRFEKRWPLMFEDIHAGWLRKFEASMIKDEIKTNAAAIHFRNIRTVFNNAIDDGIIELNLYPFRRYKIKHAETEKRSISIEEIKAIRDFETDNEVAALARDLFMLSFYMIGTNNSDLYNLQSVPANRAMFSRAKTHRDYSIKLEPEALHLIAKLKGTSNLLMVSEKYKTVYRMTRDINAALKNILPGLTMYHARHTWATLAKNNIKASEEDIAAALGHTRKTVTQIYINRDPAIVDNLNRKVLDLLKDKPARKPRVKKD